MNDETPTQTELNRPRADGQPAQPRSEGAATLQAAPPQTIVIAATFTADPLRLPLQFWMETLEIPVIITLAPYAQVMQELLNPASQLSSNVHGFNLLLVRLEDWVSNRLHETTEHNLQHIRAVARDFAAAVGKLQARTSATTLVCFCPSSSSLPGVYGQEIEHTERDLVKQLGALRDTHCWTHAEMVRLYPVAAHEDARAERIGHIPYTREYFVAIATLVARRIAVLLKLPYKVIALDCDNTLWKGVCGEGGAADVEVTAAHFALQRLLVRQHDAGVLLCLCSKNNQEDVEAVFRSRPEMPLRHEHLISWRINWNSKSSNLRSLALELDLSLDSIVFIDDSALECAEVRAHCPTVLVLQFPQAEQEVMHFLDHVWAFDRVGATTEAHARTLQYRQNRARDKALEEATDLQQFLASIELQVDVSAMQPEQLARVAELIQRTNQFNLTGVRRRAAEIETLLSTSDLRCLVMHVRDRFGDYGLVGVVLFACRCAALEVDTFVLSCRVLGRGVEHRIINELGRIARQQGLTHVALRCRHTARNEPARTFLEKSFAEFRNSSEDRQEVSAESSFIVPAAYAQTIDGISAGVLADSKAASSSAREPATTASVTWGEASYRLSRLADIVRAIDRSASRARPGGKYVAPRTAVEAAVAQIWSEVLGLAEVGVHDDFLELGGDSLLAVRAIASIGSVLGLEHSIYDFFEEPTVAQIAARLSRATTAAPAIERAEQTVSAPLSPSQQRLWFIDRLGGGGAAYHVPIAARLRGQVNLETLQSALNALIRRHEVLRTTFRDMDGVPMQLIAPDGQFALIRTDLTAQTVEQREAAVVQQACEEIGTPFDLSTGPLIRGRLLRLSQQEQVLLITMHHIVSDGWSLGVLMKELGALYEASWKGRPDLLPALPIQYADYARWQQRSSTDARLQEQLSYLIEHLRGAPALLALPADRPRPAARSHRGASVPISLGSALAAEVTLLSRRLDLTLAMTLHTAWSILMCRLSGQEDVVVGMPVANRPRRELESLVGCFVNTLAVRLTLNDDPSIEEALKRAKHVMLRAYAQQDVPFERVVEALQPERSLGHNPLFQVVFAFQNAPRGTLQLPGLTLVEEQLPSIAAQFDLTLTLQQSADDICGSLNYATDLFDRATVERWIRSFECVLRAMVGQSHVPVSAISVLDDCARRQLLTEFNATHAPHASAHLIHELFEAQVARTPQGLAVSCDGVSLTYAELNARSNRLARHLRAKGLGPDELVGICLERSVEMIVALLSVLKAGGAYVPLDPDYPSERLEYMLRDAAPRLLLTQQRLGQKLPSNAAEVIMLDGVQEVIAEWPEDNLAAKALGLRPDHLAYVIYTSGSTGRPKGAMIEHRNVTRLFAATEEWFHFGESDVWTLFHSMAFDFSVWELWGALLYGGRVVIVPSLTARSAQDFYRLLCEEGVTVLNQTPSAFVQLIDAQARSAAKHSLRVVIFGGEALELHKLQPWVERNGAERPQLVNMYGITETTVHVTYRLLTKEEISSERGSPVGKPIPDLRVYLLDRHQALVPIGVTGEIFVGGAGVARGYLNRAELTSERFLVDPFSDSHGARMYRSGDLGRWRADGTIEHLGRNDEQVKIRGFRIELGEIEEQLLQHAAVREAVVIAREDNAGDRRLIAYLVARAESSIPGPGVLRMQLQKVLPEYMVPSAFVALERMPLTPSGKLDRRALPKPQLAAYTSQQYEPPVGEMEEIVAGMWQSLLGVDRVGRDDGFFRLGGTSLSAMRLQARLQAALSMEVPVRLLFESSTLREVSARLEELRRLWLLDKAADTGVDVKELLGRVASMEPTEVHQLLRRLTTEGRL